MKTPLMELIEWIQVYCDHQPYLLPEEAKKKATELLEKEREVIQDAFDEGELNVSDLLKRKYRGSSDYYTKTFTNESK